MTRVFDAEGRSLAVNIVRAFPCVVSAIKSDDKDGYAAIQVTAKKDEKKTAAIAEFKPTNVSDYKKNDKITLDQFQAGDSVQVTGTSKGKGFAGTIKRHGFKRGPESHGGNNVREPGSIGAQQPQRVVKGRRMAGHMGVTTVTVQNLKVVDVDKDIILVSGAIPGPNKSIVKIICHADNTPVVESSEE